MKDLIANLIALRTNIVGTALVAVLASSTTLIGAHLLTRDTPDDSIKAAGSIPVAPSGPSVLDCGEGIYSPVQKTCVSQDVFDVEMHRLFAALGIDTAVYRAGVKKSRHALDANGRE